MSSIINFFKKAFSDMKESTKRQHEVDKANLKAQHLETKAFYEEQKAKSNIRKKIQEQQFQNQLNDANARQKAAQDRIDKLK
jgi:hypothetical protein